MSMKSGNRKRMSAAEFNAFVDNLQDEIFAEAKSAWGETGFARWRSPRFHGRMENADGYGRVTGGCGDTMEMFLRVKNNRVAEASYTTTGCGSSGLCGSFAAELAQGRVVETLFDLQGEDVLAKIGTFPEEDRHCAFLAISTLQDAANDYLVSSVGSRKKK